MCTDVLYNNIKLYLVRGADSCCHSHSLPGTVNYKSTERSHPRERKANLRQWRKCIWRAGGGDFKINAADIFTFDPIPTRAKNAWSSSTCLLYDVKYRKVPPRKLQHRGKKLLYSITVDVKCPLTYFHHMLLLKSKVLCWKGPNESSFLAASVLQFLDQSSL